MRTIFSVLVFFGALLLPAFAQAPSQSPSPLPLSSPSTSATPSSPDPAATTLSDFARARVNVLLRSGHAEAAWFSAVFLAQVPATQVDLIVAQIKARLGEYQTIDGTRGDYTARFVKGSDEVLVHLDADNKIDGLLFKPPKVASSSLDDALHALHASRGTLSYLIREGRTERAAVDASVALAVGSAFKLAVLAAVRDGIVSGRRHWSDVIPLDARWKSLPSGVMQNWPDGMPVTLATYATEMVSMSDNTAADALARLVGPSALAPYALRNMPFLTTREMFYLKSTPGAAQGTAYTTAPTPTGRTSVLRAIDDLPLPAIGTLASRPVLAIEWYYSVRELCDLMNRVADLPLMSINPGVADPAAFQHVAYKGGSDVGVINLTTQITTKRGTNFCVSATLNDAAQAIDESAFEAAYSSVLGVLADR